MADLWYPEALRDPFKDAGPFSGGPAKGGLHTTEGKTYASARSVYASKSVAPHFTPSYENRVFRVRQHMPINRAARALVNASGGVQTNTDGVIQLEIVAFSDKVKAQQLGGIAIDALPAPYVAGLRRLMRWIEANAGVKRRCGVTFKPYPSSYGANNGIRMTAAQWDAYDGWCGHCHVPENLHGDPGDIDIASLLDLEPENPPIQGDDDMDKIIDPKDGGLYVGNAFEARAVASLEEVKRLVNAGLAVVRPDGNAFELPGGLQANGITLKPRP